MQILSNFFWTTSDFIFPYINIIDDEFYSSHGITYGNLLHLQSLGLVTFNSLGGYKIIKQPETKSLNYFNKKIELILNNDQNRELQLGQVLLTNVGIDLASVIKGNPIEDFFDFSLNKFMTDDISIVSPVFK